jgi:hypothetical protein
MTDKEQLEQDQQDSRWISTPLERVTEVDPDWRDHFGEDIEQAFKFYFPNG